METLEPDHRKPLTAQHLRPHFKALDLSFIGMGRLFRTLTYEQGRVSAEYKDYPQESRKELEEAVAKLHEAGLLLKKAAVRVRAKSRGEDEEKVQ